MTQAEYVKKRERLAVSDAPNNIKQDAIQTLDNLFYGSSSVEVAIQQIEASQADISDMNRGD